MEEILYSRRFGTYQRNTEPGYFFVQIFDEILGYATVKMGGTVGSREARLPVIRSLM